MPSPTPPTTVLGAAIRKRRLKKEWSQTALAERIGVTQAQVSRWETGEDIPSREHFELLRTLLRLPYKVYFGTDKPPPPFIMSPMSPELAAQVA